MKKPLKMVTLFLLVAVMLLPAFQVEAKTKSVKVSVYKVSGNTVYYRKAQQFYDLRNGELFNAMNDHGYGKTYKIKVTNKTKYYFLDYNNGYAKTRMNKKAFKSQVKRWKQFGRVEYLYTQHKVRKKIYPGYVCKMTCSGKKAKKFVEVFQS